MNLCTEISWQIRTSKERNMTNIFHKNGWNSGTNPAHVQPPLIPLTKETYNGESDKYFFKKKLCRDPTYSTSYLYECKMYFLSWQAGRVFIAYNQLQYDSHGNRGIGDRRKDLLSLFSGHVRSVA